MLDGALYPPLLAAYLIRLFLPEADHLTSWLVGLVVIWGSTWINIRGVDVVGRLNTSGLWPGLLPSARFLAEGPPRVS